METKIQRKREREIERDASTDISCAHIYIDIHTCFCRASMHALMQGHIHTDTQINYCICVSTNTVIYPCTHMYIYIYRDRYMYI